MRRRLVAVVLAFSVGVSSLLLSPAAAAADPIPGTGVPKMPRVKYGPWVRIDNLVQREAYPDIADVSGMVKPYCYGSARWRVIEDEYGAGWEAGDAGQTGIYGPTVQFANVQCWRTAGIGWVGGNGYIGTLAIEGNKEMPATIGVQVAACRETGIALGSETESGDPPVKMQTWSSVDGGVEAAGCKPNKWSVNLKKGGTPGFDAFGILDIGDPPGIEPYEEPAQSEKCDFGTAVTATYSENLLFAGLAQARYSVTFNPGISGNWAMRGYVMKNGQRTALNMTKVNDQNGQTTFTIVGETSIAAQTLAEIAPLGIQIVRYSTGSTTSAMPTKGGLTWDEAGGGGTSASGFGKRTTTKYGDGHTAPEACSFWLGDKVAPDDPDSTLDDPWTGVPPQPEDPYDESDAPAPEPLVEPPAEDLPEEKCTFKFSDPTTWLSGGMCSAVGLLGGLLDQLMQIIKAIVGLPAALLDAIGALFVPDRAVMDSYTNAMRSAWGNSAVGQYGSDVGQVVQSVSIPESGSCGGPSFTLDIVGTSKVVRPLSACGEMATVANVLKVGLSLMIWIGTALVCIRLIGSSVGLQMEGFGRDSK